MTQGHVIIFQIRYWLQTGSSVSAVTKTEEKKDRRGYTDVVPRNCPLKMQNGIKMEGEENVSCDQELHKQAPILREPPRALVNSSFAVNSSHLRNVSFPLASQQLRSTKTN